MGAAQRLSMGAAHPLSVGFGDAADPGDGQCRARCAPALLQDSAKRSSSVSRDVRTPLGSASPEAERRAAQAAQSGLSAALVALSVLRNSCLWEGMKPDLGDAVMAAQLVFTAGRVKFCFFIFVAIITAKAFI